jgi:titin
MPTTETLEDRQCPSVAAPTGLHLTALSPTQVKLTWNDVAGESGFHIEEWTGTQTVEIGSVSQHVTTYTATGLTPNMVQWFAVQAIDDNSVTQGAWASITTPVDAITAPTSLKASNITLNAATLTWSAATGQTGYKIFEWNGSAAVPVGSVAATVTSFKVTNLAPGITNYFYVESFNATNFASSAWLAVTTLAPLLTSPGNLQTSVINSATIGLSWTNSASATGYKVYEWNGVSTSNPIVMATLAANTTSYQATGLQPGQTYWFYVQAFNQATTANTAWVSAATVSAAPLKGPSNLTATVTGAGSVTLSWVEPANAVGYNVLIWNGFSWVLYSTVSAGTHQASITNLSSNQTVWFLVESFTAGDAQVAYSNEVFANV